MKSIHFDTLTVPHLLRDDIASIRLIDYDGDESLAIKILPSGAPGIIFQHMNGHAAIENIPAQPKMTGVSSTLYLYGSGVEPSVMRFKAGSYTAVQITLKPHALNSLLGLNASVLANQMIPLDEISKEKFNEQLLETQNAHQQATLLTNFLAGQLSQMKTRDRLVEKGLQRIDQNIPSATVSSLIQTLNISERQFERRFRQTVGISARSYIRLKRFNAAIQLISSGQYSTLTEIAHALCFHDQSHFIRDVKAFSGFTPKALAQKADDFHCAKIVCS